MSTISGPSYAGTFAVSGLGNSASLYRGFGKRALDIALVTIILLPVCLVLLVLAGMIALGGSAPIYVQERIGLEGRVFRIFKLRTMVPNAEQVLAAYLADNPRARAEWERDQKLRNDPRVTRLGRVIRCCSLDELPQIFNVLLGDMSLVGPRPMMCDQRILYPGQEYYAMRPGITGFWQTSVRNESSFCQRAGFDTAYFTQMSLMTDLKVMLRTVGVVLRATGC